MFIFQLLLFVPVSPTSSKNSRIENNMFSFHRERGPEGLSVFSAVSQTLENHFQIFPMHSNSHQNFFSWCMRQNYYETVLPKTSCKIVRYKKDFGYIAWKIHKILFCIILSNQNIKIDTLSINRRTSKISSNSSPSSRYISFHMSQLQSDWILRQITIRYRGDCLN